MEIFSIILTLLLIPLMCLLAPVLLLGLLGVMLAFALKRGQRIYVHIPQQAYDKRKNDAFFYPEDRLNARDDSNGVVVVDEDGRPYRS